MLHASDLKHGMIVRMDKNLYKIVAIDYHMGSGKMGGLVHVKLKDIRSGFFLDRKWKPEEKVDRIELDRRTLEFLYNDAEGYYMMDPDSFEQIQLGKNLLEPFDSFLHPNMRLPVEFLAEEPVNVIFPDWVELEVVSTVHSISSLQDEVYKPTTLSNGMETQVPQLIAVKNISGWMQIRKPTSNGRTSPESPPELVR